MKALTIQPYSALERWNSLFTAYGYSNYAVNGLKTKNYARYSELVAVNAALVAAVKAGTIERSACASLMARWNAIANDTENFSSEGVIVSIFKPENLAPMGYAPPITADPPFSHVDMIACRNVLIYMSPALQQRVLPIFHYALNVPGYLVLGTSETVGQLGNYFDIVDRAAKIYVKKSEAPFVAQLPGAAFSRMRDAAPAAQDHAARRPRSSGPAPRPPSSILFPQTLCA